MRVTTRDPGNYPWYLRPFFWSQRRRYGQVLLPGLVWGRIPRLFMSVALLYGALDSRRSALSPVLRSLVTVRVSQLNWCRFCVDVNAMVLTRRAGSGAKLAALEGWAGTSDVYTAEERLALEYAEAMTLSDRRVDDDLATRLRGAFGEDGLVELTALIAFQNLSSKFNAALDIPPQGFCQRPPHPGGD